MGWQLKQWPSVVADFLKEVGVEGEARIFRDLRKMAELGHRFRGDTKSLGRALFELRVSHKRRAFRLIYVHHAETAVFLVCFEKKSQKTPKAEIDLAHDRHTQLVNQEVQLGRVTIN